jgi:hypothetical protein
LPDFSEQQWVWNGGPLGLVNNLRSYLNGKVAAPGLESRSYDRRDS